jgi:hypothetical protein
MQRLLTIIALSLSIAASAQNVGIGTATPNMKLHVSSLSDTALLQVDNNAVLANNTNVGMYFKNGSYYTGAIKTTGTGSNVARLGFYTFAIANQNQLLERMSILDNGNVGIGTNNPSAKLEVNGSVKITGGTPGTGKVLTSDANGLATWENETFSNTERFGFKVKGNLSTATNLSVVYNTSTTTPSLTASNTATQQTAVLNMLVSKAGLYHFSFAVSSRDLSSFGSGSELFVEISRVVSGTPTEIVSNYLPLSNGGSGWAGHYDKELEMVVPAGVTIRLTVRVSAAPPSQWFLDSFVAGHLIAE